MPSPGVAAGGAGLMARCLEPEGQGLMINRAWKIVAAGTLAGLSGTAVALDTTQMSLGAGEMVPWAVASPALLDEHRVASAMIGLLPAEHRAAVVAAGGIGSEAVAARRGVNAGPASAIAMVRDEAFRAGLSEDQLNIVDAMVATIERGEPLAALCFAPGTDERFIGGVNMLFDAWMNNGRFQQTNRWSSTATNGAGLTQGQPITLTYSFMPDGTAIRDIGIGTGSGTSSLFAWLNGIYGNPGVWQPLFAQVFARWSELIGVDYVYEPNDDGSQSNTGAGIIGVRGDVRIGAFNLANDSSNGGVLAYNNFPNDGDMVFDRDTFFNNTTNNSRRLRNVISHEHGHGLGMAHVCPIANTKLMEPFASTVFDGPQLDDILNGQRHYGDLYEPQSDDPTNAPNLGAVAVGGIIGLTNVSIDDNSDADFYEFTLTTPAEVQISVSPDAATYVQGPQTGACNSGTNSNYNAIHDLSISVVTPNNPFNPIATVNATGVGGAETLVLQLTTPGDYVIQVNGSNVNNIQRYAMGVFVNSIGNCSAADLAEPFGVLNFFDISAYLGLYNAGASGADIAEPFGQINFFDISAYLGLYNAGCP